MTKRGRTFEIDAEVWEQGVATSTRLDNVDWLLHKYSITTEIWLDKDKGCRMMRSDKGTDVGDGICSL